MAMAMSEEARKGANLRLLQRRSDKSIADILGSATHVVLYEFQQSSQSWEKSNVEGSLFLVTGDVNGYQLIILNRNSSENYHLSVTKDLQLQHRDPYLMFKQHDDATNSTAIRGIWFHSADERKDMLSLLSHLVQQLKAEIAPKAAEAPVAPPVDQTAATAALMSTLGISPSNAAAPAVVGHAVSPTAPAPARTMPTAATTPEPQKRQPRPAASPSSPAIGQAPLLDKKSLQLALLSLLQDDRFLDLLHAQYLKVAHARAGRNRGNGNT